MLGEDELVVEGVEEDVEGVRDTEEERAEDAVDEVLLTDVW